MSADLCSQPIPDGISTNGASRTVTAVPSLRDFLSQDCSRPEQQYRSCVAPRITISQCAPPREGTPSQPHRQDFEAEARADRLRLLYRQSFSAALINAASALLLLPILWPHLDQMFILGWLGAIFLSCALRLSLFLGYRRSEHDGTSFFSLERPYLAVLSISSLVWGLGCAWMMSQVPILHQAIIYCFLIGMAGGAISVYSAIQTLVLTTVAALLLPATAWLLLRGDANSGFLGMGGTLFLLSTIPATKILANALHYSFLLNHQLQEATELAELSARTDFLTGLNNRRHFCEMAAMQAEFCRRQRYPISLILLDVDDFKKINDSKGHHSGDLALQHLSTILRQSIRSSDICGRIGGEEFAVLLLKADLGDAETMAERIRSTIDNNPVETKGGGFKITVSVGVATGDFGVEVLLRMADKALYRAKEAGRNQVCQYSSSVDGLLGVT